jgi:hypothetical protein
MCSCVKAFSVLRPCAILVVGVSGSLPIHGIGTANFVVTDSRGIGRIWKIHNCLLSHRCDGEEEFNLISVSQILRTRRNAVSFGMDVSRISFQTTKQKGDVDFMMVADDGFYHVDAIPISQNDRRFNTMDCFDVTLETDPVISLIPVAIGGENSAKEEGPTLKPPSRLGAWFVKILWMGTVRTFTGMVNGFGEELLNFCDNYIAPLSIPTARRTYQIDNIDDVSDLSIRFLGIGTERLERTLERSIGLSPMIKKDGKMRHKVPTHNFPQGAWKQGKTPRVAKGIVHGLHRAAIGEVVFTDTFEVDDTGFRYGQAYVDYRSKYGDVIPLRSRKQVGLHSPSFIPDIYTFDLD